MARWRRFAGELLPEMLKSEEAALRFLRHESAEVRTAGIQVLKNHWRVRDVGSFSDTCEALIVRNTDPAFDMPPRFPWGSATKFSDNVRVSVLLAQVVRNGSELDEVRRAAYFALIRVRRSGTRLHPTAAAKLKDLRKLRSTGGLLRSRLTDRGLPCRLTVPPPSSKGAFQRSTSPSFGFTARQLRLLVAATPRQP